MRFLKSLPFVLAAIGLGAMASLHAATSTITTIQGVDLMMGFQATGGTGVSINLEIDLGAISGYVSDPGTKRQVTVTIAGTTSAALSSADLAQTYGVNWNSRTDLYWAMAGFTSTATNPVLYVSKVETTPGVTSDPFTTDLATQRMRSDSRAQIQSAINGFNGYTSTNNSPVAAQKLAAQSDSWTSVNVLTSAAFNNFPDPLAVNNLPVSASNAFAVSDLWVLAKDGTVSYVGSFALDSAGVLWFSKNPGDFASPVPAITSQPSAANANDGGTATFTVQATGNPAPGFQWQVSTNGGTGWSDLTESSPYSGTTTGALQINPVSLAMTGYQYRVKATNGSGTATSDGTAKLTVYPVAPTVTAQPQSQSVNQGSTITFTVSATGTATLTYQWKLGGGNLIDDGSHISGATTNSLTIGGVQLSDAGSYTVLVSNTAGSATSNAAILTVAAAPAVPAAGAASNVTSGGFTANWSSAANATSYYLDVSTSSTFSTFVGGYQDLDMGSQLSAAITGLGENTTYYYRVRAVNTVGTSASSQIISVTTQATPLAIVTQPVSQAVVFGSNVTFTVQVTSNTSLTFQWQLGGQNLTSASATTDTLELTAVQAADAGNYTVIVTNAAGSVTSDIAVLTVIVPPAAPVIGAATGITTCGFVANWSSVAGATGYRLDVSTSNTFSSFVGIYHDLDVGANPSRQVTGLTDNTVYYYRVRAVNTAGAGASSNTTTVTTLPAALTITTQPSSQSVIQGANVTFHVAASSSTPLTYQWRHDSTNLTSASATTDTLSLNNVQPADAGNYDVVVTNAAGPVASSIAALTVQAPPSAPVGVDATAIGIDGFTANWNAANDATGYKLDVSTDNAFGTFLNGYQDLDVGANLSNPLGGLASFTTYYYRVRAVNAAGTSPSSNVVTVTTLPAPPAIAAQPQQAGAHPGDTVTLSVAVTGTPPFTYQWRKKTGGVFVDLVDGGTVSGATTATLTLTGVTVNDGGDYVVVVTNTANGITSDPATVTVTTQNIAPVFTLQPAGQTANQGGAVTFTVGASGVPTPTITWLHEGAIITGATGARLTVANVQAVDAGRYTAVATNVAGSVNSNDATLVVNLPPIITTAPQGQTVDQGGSVTFTVVATGLPAPTYQWFKNNNAISGATASSYAIDHAQASDAGDYTVVATNVAGSATSAKATLVVNLPPAITTQPASLNVNLGSSASFTVAAAGVPAPTYQWFKDGAPIGGATGSTYAIAIVQASDAGRYSAVATNRLGTTTSTDAVLVVNVAPVFTTPPAGQTVDQGASVTFSAAASGVPAPAYQWLKNGSAISGATGSALTLNNVQASDAGDYTVLATNLAGSATSAKAALVVNYTPVITTQPAPMTAAQGTGATFTVVASGVPSPTYQWRKNGNAIDGATTATFTLATVVPADAGNYSVAVTNRLGTATSADAALTVNYAPTITTQPASATTTIGNNATFSVVAKGVPAPTYQWQLSLDGGTTWSSVAEATPYSGTTTTVLRITAATTTMNNLRYRVVARNSLGTATSNPAILTVSKPAATVTLGNLSVTYDGTAKAATVTTVPDGLNVTVTYNGATTAPIAAGSYTVVATVNDASYSGTATDTLTIAKVTPRITWNAPAAVTYGTALTSTQLNATANVPGTIAFTPGVGAIPGAGNVTLSATFTPTDTTNYATATATQTLVVNPAMLTATADSKTRVFGAANPTFTVSYTGFVAGDTKAALTSEPTATTTAASDTAPGAYPITLSGGMAANYALTLANGTLTITPQDYSGEYFGKFAGGGTWALAVHADRTATFIAYLPDRHSAMVVQLTVDATGSFNVASTEIVPQSTTSAQGAVRAESVAPEASATTNAAGSAFTLAGRIADGLVSGQLVGFGQTLAGAIDTGAGPAPGAAGFYTAVALQAASGTSYAVVGTSGHAFALVVAPALVDGVAGAIDASGQLAGTTANGAQLTLSVDATGQTVAVSVTPAGANAPLNFAGAADTLVATGRLVNLSVRSSAGLGDQTLIAGFVVGGSGSKPVLLRGVGPALNSMGVTGFANDPMLVLYSGGAQPVQLATNDDWQMSTTTDRSATSMVPAITSQVGAFALAGGSLDAALYVPTQITAGAYTMHVTNRTGTTGVALAEIYDAGVATRAVRLVNVSARAQVGTGTNVLIAGFVVQGAPPVKLLVRAVGPTLANYGVGGLLADPKVDIYQSVNGASVWIAGNDNWGGTAALANAFTATGAFTLPVSSKDAAVLLTLPSGVYSAVVSGVNNTTGVAMVEVYEVP